MNVSGNTISPAPFEPASLMRATAFSTVASRSRKTGVAWTAAALTLFMPSPPACSCPPRGACRIEGRVALRKRVPCPVRALPVGNRRLALLPRDEGRGLYHAHPVDVPGTVGEHLPGPDAHDELRLRVFVHERVVFIDRGHPVQANPVPLLEVDEEQAHVRVLQHVAHRQVHAVAVVVR